MHDFGCKGKSLNFNENLFLARAFNSRDEGDSVFLFFLEFFFQPMKRKMVLQCTEDDSFIFLSSAC
jgi:hypothetical protein